MKLGVIGGGTVGRATARSYLEYAEVRVYDVVRERATHSLRETLECDLVFVCLPTPQKAGSRACDVSALDRFFAGVSTTEVSTGKHDRLTVRGSPINFVLRSTVPVGTTRRLREQYNLPNLVHSPEFLTARCACTDAQVPARNVIGKPEGKGNRATIFLMDLYATRFPGVPVHPMTSDESEAVKLFTNGFGAVALAYWNECRCLADAREMDWGRVMEGVLSDGRIPHSWTRVPGPDGKRGFGGECLPKDLANLVDCIDQHKMDGLYAMVTLAALRRNEEDRKRPAAAHARDICEAGGCSRVEVEEAIREAMGRDMG